jgi:Domain of unknown function (DUF4214)/CARDB
MPIIEDGLDQLRWGNFMSAFHSFSFQNLRNPLGCAMVLVSLLAVSPAQARTYSTSFTANENPISENNSWIDGHTVGIDWNNVQTTSGMAMGVINQVGPYNDPTAVLTGSWATTQSVTGVVALGSATAFLYPEVELRTNTTIMPHNITGYEFDCSVLNHAGPNPINGGCSIVRWNGPLNNFTILPCSNGTLNCNPNYVIPNGATILAINTGSATNNLKAYVNGVLIASSTDHTYTAGSPGIGFNGAQSPGGNAVYSNFALSSFSATDQVGTTTSLPDVIVTALSYANGIFTSTVKNQGAAATPSGVLIGVGYFVDAVWKTWGGVNGPLAAGASVTIGTNGGSYIIPDGSHTIMAFADDVNRFPESNETNNQLSKTITVGTTTTQQIQQIYLDILGRTADSSGLTYWVGQLNSGVSLKTIRTAFANSSECITDINKLYMTALGRNATSTELATKISFLINGGTLATITVP